jgi:hypothetical protein
MEYWNVGFGRLGEWGIGEKTVIGHLSLVIGEKKKIGKFT